MQRVSKSRRKPGAAGPRGAPASGLANRGATENNSLPGKRGKKRREKEGEKGKKVLGEVGKGNNPKKHRDPLRDTGTLLGHRDPPAGLGDLPGTPGPSRDIGTPPGLL
ncbi:PREDICTED: collagen alpha-2(VIII) chain-like [Tinamus guttatus]|uniref:collagen alpha-2(VIII) chain-like n=1 Tax=Tinamus guttatus TaxID=94827 RepID=UPI00052EFEFA|nr:PREDICTED: collagen alpha-2(VIII) chain-like [Tinamus guttatus]